MQHINKTSEAKEVVKKKNTKLGIIICTLIGFILIGAATILYLNSLNNDKIYPNTFVLGIDIGNLTVDEATKRLSDNAHSILGQPAILSFNNTAKEYSYEELGVKILYDKTAEVAFGSLQGGSWIENIANELIKVLPNGTSNNAEAISVDPIVEINEATLNNIINAVASDGETEATPYSYEMGEEALLINPGEEGYIVDRELVKLQLTESFLKRKTEPILLELIQSDPKPFDVDAIYNDITAPPENAYYSRNEENDIIVVAGRGQAVIEKDELSQLLNDVNGKTEIKLDINKPQLTSDELNADFFKDQLSSYTTYFNGNDVGRTINVRRGAALINESVILPGEDFAFSETVGRRTVENGFDIGSVYVNGRSEKGIGGGICQTSSTMYYAALCADLEIVERHNHSMPVGYTPGGTDATVSYGSLELIFKNNTNYPIKIVTGSTNSSVTITIMGTKESNKTVEIVNTTSNIVAYKTFQEVDRTLPPNSVKVFQNGINGSTVVTYRIVKIDGAEVKRELVSSSRYVPMNRIEFINPIAESEKQTSLISDGTTESIEGFPTEHITQAEATTSPENLTIDIQNNDIEGNMPNINTEDLYVETE